MDSGSGWNLWVWLAGGGCRWKLWMWLVGVAVRRYIDFLILLIPTPLAFVLFCSSIPTFCSFLIMFFVLVPSVRYSSICNVLRLWSISLIPTYRIYRLCDIKTSFPLHNHTHTSHTHTHRTLQHVRRRICR